MIWSDLISDNLMVREEMRRLDSIGLWPYLPPRAPLSQSGIDSLERSVGFALDPGYRSFLGCADGWPAFYQSLRLFGSVELNSGDALLRARELLDVAAAGGAESIAPGSDGFTIVAAAQADIDLFLMPLKAGVQMSPVIWLAGREIERFASFVEFFEAMVAHNRADLADLRARPVHL